MLSNAIRQADDTAFNAVPDGTNESQDTLLIARRLMLDYGVALQSSPTEEGDTSSPQRDHFLGDSAGKEDLDGLVNSLCVDKETTRGTRAGETAQIHDSFSLPETQDADVQGNQRPVETRKSWDVVIENGVFGDLNLPDSLPLSAEIDSTSRRKMDSTQASTQPNAGRSYDQYRRPSSQDRTSPVPRPVRSNSLARDEIGDIHNDEEEQREEEEDDADIRFDFTNTTDTGKAGFVGQNDSGYVDFGSLINSRHPASQKATESPIQHWPETPGPPQNPFQNSRSELLSMSQLFRGTQFSSPVKLASPTSSRPSPAEFLGNSISSNPAISSPLKARGLRSSPGIAITSSPEVLPGTASSKLGGRESSPVDTGSTENPVVPESSHDEPVRKRSVPEPLATYEPMQKSQERRSIFTAQTNRADSGDELDSPDSMLRRRRALQKKEAALRHLNAISFPRQIKHGDVEVPSTSQRRGESQTDAAVFQGQANEAVVDDLDNADNLGTVEEPQHRRLKSTQILPVVDDDPTQSDAEEEEVPTIVRTSTAASEPPHPSTNPAPELGQAPGGAITHEDTILETSPTSKRVDPSLGPAPSNDPYQLEDKSTPNFQSSPPAFSTRAQKGKPARGRPRVLSSSSPLSNLGSTPSHATSDASGIVKSGPPGSPTESTIVASSSPFPAQSKRRDGRERLPKLKTVSNESLRQSRRRNRRDSNSTDELTRSISGTPTFEQSLRVSRLSIARSVSRAGRAATRPSSTQREQKLFKNMAFAISFQARKPGETNDQYNSRTDFSGMVQKRLRQAGGRILENGFDELFEAVSLDTPTSSPVSTNSTSDLEAEIRLTAEGRTIGFTALIADGHSRKAKYMQALALGLPCIAARWVTTCLDRNELVDWTPYLLCAGQSAFLGDAIRSRCLAPYDAATARLLDVFAAREKLLEGSRILAVVKKALEGKKVAYVFLARVLGASLTRVYNVEAAKAELKAAEDAGRPFDWVYVDGKAYEDALFAPGPGPGAGGTGGGGKKRKRASAAASFVEPPVKRVRTLGEELVIQSLILGRLIGEGEMDD